MRKQLAALLLELSFWLMEVVEKLLKGADETDFREAKEELHKRRSATVQGTGSGAQIREHSTLTPPIPTVTMIDANDDVLAMKYETQDRKDHPEYYEDR